MKPDKVNSATEKKADYLWKVRARGKVYCLQFGGGARYTAKQNK